MGFALATGSTGNISSASSLAASGSRSAPIDASASAWKDVYIGHTAGSSVSSTSGLQFAFYPTVGTSTVTATMPSIVGTVPAVASTAQGVVVSIPQGRYTLTLTNLDASYATTPVATADTYA